MWIRLGHAVSVLMRTADVRSRRQESVVSSLAVAGALALSLLLAHPVAAQDGRQVDNADTGQGAASDPLPSSYQASQDGVRAIDTPNRENEIVYIDDQGVIRVFDPQPPLEDDLPPVVFRSPEETFDWFDVAVDDLNGDGDDEIIAIAQNGVVKLFDPVVNTTVLDPSQQYGGIYWELLFETQVVGEPTLVTTGEFDDNPTTREIVIVALDPNDSNASLIQILFQPAPPFNGRTWIPLTDVRFGAVATSIATGDLDGDGRDDLAVVATGVGRLSILRREANNVLGAYWSSVSDSRPWTDVVIGKVATGSPLPELVAVRRAAPPLAALVVQRYRPIDDFEDVLLRDHLPAPRQVLLADVRGGSAEQQIFMLRDVPEADTRPRLFNSRTGSGTSLIFEVRLDSDNGYRVMAAGDLDADDKDELVLVRNTGILIFNEPATSTTQTRFLSVPTNERTLALGNLDALGRDVLTSDPSSLTFSVPAGDRASAQSFTLSNRTRVNQIDFALEVQPRVSFVSATPTVGATRATVAVTVDATDLLPLSVAGAVDPALLVQPAGALTATYGANLVVGSPDPLVLNTPLNIPVIVVVTPGVVVRPKSITAFLEATESSPDCRASLPLTLEVQVLGTLSSTFNPASGATWLSVETSQNEITAGATAVLTVTLDAQTTPLPTAETEVVLNAVVPGGGAMVRRIPVKVACFPNLLRLPIIQR